MSGKHNCLLHSVIARLSMRVYTEATRLNLQIYDSQLGPQRQQTDSHVPSADIRSVKHKSFFFDMGMTGMGMYCSKSLEATLKF